MDEGGLWETEHLSLQELCEGDLEEGGFCTGGGD